MKIERLDLIAYGHLTDVTIDLSAKPYQFHLIVGRNESGKSTSMRAINAWLFGFPGQTPDDYVHTMKKLRVGGVVSDEKQSLHCVRRKGNKNTLLDGADGKSSINEASLQEMLGGIDATTFASQFAISHEELVAGGEMILQGQGELGEMLFAAGAGLGKLKKVQEQLKHDYETIFKRLGKSRIADTLKIIKQMKEDLKKAQVPPAEYARLQSELADKQAEIEELKREADTLSHRRARLLAQIEALPIIPMWQQATKDFSEVAGTPILSADFTDRRRNLAAEMSIATSNIERVESSLSRLRLQLSEVKEDKPIRDNRREIETLIKELPVREKAEADRKGFMSNVLHSQERDLRAKLADLAKVTSQSSTDNSQRSNLEDQVHQYQLNESERKKIVRLAGEYARVVTGCEDKRRQVERLRQRIESCGKELEALPLESHAEGLSQVLAQIGQPSAMVENLREARSQVQRFEDRCEVFRSRLRLDQSLDRIVTMELPDPAIVSQTSARINSIDEETEIARRRVLELKRQLADEEAGYEAIETKAHLPSLGDLDKARQVRDRMLAAIHKQALVHAERDESSLTDASVDSFETDSVMQAVRRADEIADQLRMHQKEVHQRETMVATIRKLTAKVQQAQSEWDKQKELQANIQEHWNIVWTEKGITPGSPQAMRDWIDEHEKLVALAESLEDERASLKRFEASVEDATQRLAVALNLNADALEGANLLDLHAKASLIAEQNDALVQQRKLTMQQIEGWTSELSEAETTLNARKADLVAWQEQWDVAMHSLSRDSSAKSSLAPEDVIAMLDSIKDLSNLKKDRDDMLHRMTSIENETQAFLKSAARTVHAVHGDEVKIMTEGDDTSVLLQHAASLIQELHQRSKQESIDSAARDRLREDIAKAEQELKAESLTMQRHFVLRDELLQESGSESLEALPAIEAQWRRRETAAAQVRSTENDLRRLAGGEDLERFIEGIGDVQPAILEDHLAETDRDRKRISDQLELAIEGLGAIGQLLKQMDGGETASDISQAIAGQLGQLSSDVEAYVRLKLAGAILNRAIEHYRSENQEPVLQIAETYFRELTGGAYVGLNVDYPNEGDVPILHGRRASGDDVPVSGMSSGTADALYLALRLASLKHRCDSGKPMPLIIDDCLQRFDEVRSAAALRVLSKLSASTQVIMFTHHDHLEGLARESLEAGEFHVHRLAT
ncbi:AAA family ATPase [Rubripirellula amarantea]|nr:AAA family ATPase [Rubripirellula amarantea]